jgi:hypothetical protein
MGRPPIGKTAMTDAERMRRYRLKRAKPAAKPANIAALAQELAAARARIAALEAELRAVEFVAAREELRAAELGAELGARFAPKPRPAKPRAAKPPLPPDEVREQRIKAQATQIQNLKTKMAHMAQLYSEAIEKAGGMPRATQLTLDKALHPDTRRHMTEAQWLEAAQLWNAWKTSNSKVRRR